MTHTMKLQMFGWRRRAALAAVGVAVAVTAILGPEKLATTRLGAASEVAGYATVTAADTITSADVLAEVAAAMGVSNNL
jgi:hypothetical protein